MIEGPSQLTVLFRKDRETKNTVKFEEVVASGRERGVVGSIYILKSDLEKIGSPIEIMVTINQPV